MFKRIAVFLYGAKSYMAFLAAFLYAIGFLGNFGVPKAIDSGRDVPLSTALAIDVALLGLFAIQHSLMARQWFKRAWTRIVPGEAERSTYVLFSSVALFLLFWKWQPIGGTIWSTDAIWGKAAIYTLYVAGWLIVLVSTFLINHFDLFGLRQVWLYLKGVPYTPLKFRTPGLYRMVRHPLYLGWLLVFWSAPTMTVAHLIFALATTGYILIAIQLEERDLSKMHPEYQAYRKEVPMILPIGSSHGLARRKEQPKEAIPA